MIIHLVPDILECKVKWALTKLVEVMELQLSYQILKDDAVKVLHSICQKNWKTQQWPQDWKRFGLDFIGLDFIPIPKKDYPKEC